MRLLFLSAQLPGHLDWGGYLASAAELSRRGHRVLWASGEEVQPLVQAAGVPFHALAYTGWRWPPPPPLAQNDTATDSEWRSLRATRALDQWLDVTRVSTAVQEISGVAEAFQPDVIVSETFIAASGLVAERLGTPFVVAGWPAFAAASSGDSELVQEARQRLDTLCTAAGVRGANWTADGPPALLSPWLHLTFWSASWYRGLRLLPQTHHVGGRAAAADAPDALLPPPGDRPWVLITLGTSFSYDPTFFLAAAWAAENLGALPILALGRPVTPSSTAGWADRLPPSAVLRDQVPFAAVLPYTAAAIHHGGAGTTHALVTYAVPQVIVPHAADQMHQATGATRSGVGLHVPSAQVTAERLTAALAAILPDRSALRQAALRLQQEFAELGGVSAAAEVLEALDKTTA